MLNRIAVLAGVLALFSTAAESARANSLLSGYGGPGQGEQAILGSTLIGGGSGGGAGSATGSPAATTRAQRSDVPSGAAAPSAGGARAGTVGASAQGGPSPSAAGTSSLREPAKAYFSSATASTPALGVSTSDLLYIIAALAALVVSAALTRTLTRGER